MKLFSPGCGVESETAAAKKVKKISCSFSPNKEESLGKQQQLVHHNFKTQRCGHFEMKSFVSCFISNVSLIIFLTFCIWLLHICNNFCAMFSLQCRALANCHFQLLSSPATFLDHSFFSLGFIFAGQCLKTCKKSKARKC